MDGPAVVESADFSYTDAASSSTAIPCYNALRGSYYIINVYAWLPTFTASDGVVRGNGNRYASQVSVLRDKLKRADYILDESASNWDQHWRFQCDSTNQPKIESLQVDRCADSYCETLTETDVRMSGFNIGNHTNRNYIYFYWLDSSIAARPSSGCYGAAYCPAENNVDPSYGVRMPFVGNPTSWKGRTFVHETMHALDAASAVDSDALHATGWGHCTDAYHPEHANDGSHNHHDVMCYDDGGPNYVSRRLTTCATEPAGWVDCNKDDYWKPSGGTHIADIQGALTVFNTAKSIWLSSLCSEATTPDPLTCQRNDGRIN